MIQIKEDAKSYHTNLFPHLISKKIEVKRLVNMGVLKKIKNYQWLVPSFITTKKM